MPLPGRLSTVPVSRNFFNSLLTPGFVQLFSGNSSVNLFDIYPFNYKLFIKILSLSLNTMLIVGKHCSDVCYDEFSMPQIDCKGKLDGCIVWNAHNTVLGEEALLIYIVPVC